MNRESIVQTLSALSLGAQSRARAAGRGLLQDYPARGCAWGSATLSVLAGPALGGDFEAVGDISRVL
jgi:hypothetical protein